VRAALDDGGVHCDSRRQIASSSLNAYRLEESFTNNESPPIITSGLPSQLNADTAG
jgi:hypothetical protein